MSYHPETAKEIALRTIDVHRAKALVESGEAVLIDVREFVEYEDEHIPGAALYPLSTFEACRPAGDGAKIGIFHCRSGRRTAEHFSRFLGTGFSDVAHLDGGIVEWSLAGFPVRSIEETPPEELLLPCEQAAA